MNNKNNDIYLQERARLIELCNRSIEQFDKGILTISTGALALSITFVKNLVPNPVDNTKIFLILTWIFLGSSMLITLLSFLLSHQAFIKAIKDLSVEKSKFNFFTLFTHIFNFLSAISLITGFTFWGIFMFINF
jgi:hypothetical protein